MRKSAKEQRSEADRRRLAAWASLKDAERVIPAQIFVHFMFMIAATES
jgi:hypothetical protein